VTIDELNEAMKKLTRIRDARSQIVGYKLPAEEIEQIKSTLTHTTGSYPAEESATVSTLFGVTLSVCLFGRFAVLCDGSCVPLNPGTYEFNTANAIPLPPFRI
jgi:hypothetical protein